MKKLLMLFLVRSGALFFCTLVANVPRQGDEKKEISATVGIMRVTSDGDSWAYFKCMVLGMCYRHVCNYGQPICAVSISPNRRYVAFSSAGNIVHVWDNDYNSFAPRQSINAQYHDQADDLLNGKLVIKIADKIRALQQKITRPAVRRCIWSPDSKQLITVSNGLEREVWNTHTWQKMP